MSSNTFRVCVCASLDQRVRARALVRGLRERGTPAHLISIGEGHESEHEAETVVARGDWAGLHDALQRQRADVVHVVGSGLVARLAKLACPDAAHVRTRAMLPGLAREPAKQLRVLCLHDGNTPSVHERVEDLQRRLPNLVFQLTTEPGADGAALTLDFRPDAPSRAGTNPPTIVCCTTGERKPDVPPPDELADTVATVLDREEAAPGAESDGLHGSAAQGHAVDQHLQVYRRMHESDPPVDGAPDPVLEGAPGARDLQQRVLEWLRIVVTLIAFAVIFWAVSPSELLGHLAEVSFLWLGLRTVPYALGIAFQGLRWRAVLNELGEQPHTWHIVERTWMARFFSQMLPGYVGGDAFRMLEPLQGQRHHGRVASSVVLDRLVGLASLVILVCVAGLLAALVSPDLAIGPFIGSAAAIGILCLFLLFHSGPALWLGDVLYRLPGTLWKKPAAGLLDHWQKLTQKPRALLSAVGYGFLSNILVPIDTYFVFVALGITIDPLVVIALIPLINLSNLLPISLNGLGVREGIFAAAFTAAGLPASAAVATALLARATESLLASWGGVLYLRERRRTHRGRAFVGAEPTDPAAS